MGQHGMGSHGSQRRRRRKYTKQTWAIFPSYSLKRRNRVCETNCDKRLRRGDDLETNLIGAADTDRLTSGILVLMAVVITTYCGSSPRGNSSRTEQRAINPHCLLQLYCITRPTICTFLCVFILKFALYIFRTDTPFIIS